MIIRILVIWPQERSPDEFVVFQVPENSAAHQLLISMLDDRKLEWVEVPPPPRKKPVPKKSRR